MCIRAILWALDTPVGDLTAKLVLIALADHADDDNFQCWPSVSRIARRCEIARSTAYDAITFLISHDFLKHERRRDTATGSNISPMFTLNVTPLVRQPDKGVVRQPDKLVRQLPDNPCPPARTTREPSLEPSIEPKSARGAIPLFESQQPTKKEKQTADCGAVPPTPEAALFARGREMLGASAGGLIKRLLKAKDGNVALARAALETASTKGNPREYIGGVLRKAEDDEGGRMII